ncbi:MAG TPA: hypothetical protein VGO45_08290 [Bacteroidia bacterium]|jgi:hypothetical protein|nr:hypothetical protein [Bacteroidia bacterium]
MKRSNLYLFLFSGILLLILLSGSLHAQGCSQCRLVPQSDQQGGGSAAGGINKAILYMMALPYIILFLLFRKQLIGFYKQFRAKGQKQSGETASVKE